MRYNTRSLVRSQGGFTIIETMIVIGISGALLLSAVLMVSGQQRRVEFSQSAQDMRSVIEQVVTETRAGHYPDTGNFSCIATPANITITAGTTTQGSNTNCIFLGRVMQFGNGSNHGQYVVHTIAGYKDNDGSIDAAIAKAVDLDSSREYENFHNGLTVSKMRYVDGAGAPHDINSVAILQGLGEVDADNNFVSGAQQMMLVPITGTSVGGTSVTDIAASINGTNSTNIKSTSPVNPKGGVQLCLASGGTTQWALIKIGGNGRSDSVTLEFKGADCW